MEHNQTKYERLTIVLVYISLVITLVLLLLFLLNTNYSFKLPIDPAIFGQFGDVVGGLVGSIFSLISFFLIYETLREQRLQFMKLKESAEVQLQLQKEQIQKQSEDLNFYHALDRQLARVTECRFKDKRGFEIFKVIVDDLQQRLYEEFLNIGMPFLVNNFREMDEETINSFITLKNYNIKDEIYFADSLEVFKAKFILDLYKQESNDDKIEFLVRGMNDANVLRQFHQLVRTVGCKQFYRSSYKTKLEVYVNIFKPIYKQHYDFISAYFNEHILIVRLIKTSLNSSLYSDYYFSQVTHVERILFFYYLKVGFKNKIFWEYLRDSEFFLGFRYHYFKMKDSPTEDQVNVEILEIGNHYQEQVSSPLQFRN